VTTAKCSKKRKKHLEAGTETGEETDLVSRGRGREVRKTESPCFEREAF